MTASGSRAVARAPTGAVLAATALGLPLAGLALMIGAPGLDVRWEHHPAHFWLVLAAGALNAALAYATGAAARRRGDARVLLVSLGFLAAAGFLGLHALATPGVLLERSNAGFAIATPVGLVVSAAFAAASAADLTARGPALVRRARLLQNGLLAVMAAWGVVSLAELPPLDGAPVERASGPLIALAAAGLVLYGVGVLHYARLALARPAPLVVSFAVALVLLAEAMVAVAVGRNWHATWWEWHLLMLAGFALVAWGAHRQWHEERFSDLYAAEGGASTREVSVLFADLQSFTSFSERHGPDEVRAMLDEYFRVAIPPVAQREGGQIDRLIGDAIMAVFNGRGDQPDHAARAARAALALQRETARVAAAHPEWPRFRVGVSTGVASVGVLGTAGGRTHTVIGDTVNVAARLEGVAPVGGVAVAAETARELGRARLEPLGRIAVKGRAEPVEAHVLLDLPER